MGPLTNHVSDTRASKQSQQQIDNPLREYMETMQKFKDQMKDTPDLLMDKINSLVLRSEYARSSAIATTTITNFSTESMRYVPHYGSSNSLPFAPDLLATASVAVTVARSKQPNKNAVREIIPLHQQQ